MILKIKISENETRLVEKNNFFHVNVTVLPFDVEAFQNREEIVQDTYGLPVSIKEYLDELNIYDWYDMTTKEKPDFLKVLSFHNRKGENEHYLVNNEFYLLNDEGQTVTSHKEHIYFYQKTDVKDVK